MPGLFQVHLVQVDQEPEEVDQEVEQEEERAQGQEEEGVTRTVQGWTRTLALRRDDHKGEFVTHQLDVAEGKDNQGVAHKH